MRYDGTITVVDAKNILKRLAMPVEKGKVDEAEQQILFADKIILSKIDLVDWDETLRVKDRLVSMNKFARLLPAVKGKVDLGPRRGAV